MFSVQGIVADHYRFVVGVDTHAASHSYAVVDAAGAVLEEETFPTTRPGLRAALSWIGRTTGGDVDAVLVSAECTGSYGAVLTEKLLQIGYRVVEAPTPVHVRGKGKTDALDAVRAARGILTAELGELCDARTGDVHDAAAVLATARENLTAERTRAINELTALIRSYDLGLDATHPLTPGQIRQIARWRRRTERYGLSVARDHAAYLARRIGDLDTDLAANKAALEDLTRTRAPELRQMTGVGPVSAAVLLAVIARPGRIRSEVAFAKLTGVAPIPASSGNTERHRLNRGGDRRANRAIHQIVLTRWRTDPTTHAYIARRRAEGKTDREIRRCLKRYVTRQIWRTLTTAHRDTHTTP